MRIAFVLGTTAGGTGRHVQMLAAGCAARGVQAEVFAPGETQREFAFGPDVTVRTVEFADRPRSRDGWAVLRLRRLITRFGVDTVHAHGLRAGALTAIALAFIRPGRRPPLVVTVHNAPPSAGVTGAVYRALEQVVARGAAMVLCVSGDLEERMRRAGARSVGRALVPSPGPDGQPDPDAVEAARKELTGGTGRPVILAAGRLAEQKGFASLIEAARRWQDLDPAPLLVIAGHGPLQADLAVAAASLGPAVRFLGHRDDVPALLAAADLFVLPSVWEGQPLVLQEALRAGRPIVASRVGGIPDLTGEDGALLVAPGDVDALAAAVRRVLTDNALAQRLAAAARDRAQVLPSADDAIEAALSACRRLAPPAPAPGAQIP